MDTLTTKTEKLHQQKLQPPPMFQVIIFNDDITPMDFVVLLLCEVFHMQKSKAVVLMKKIHNDGKTCCGVYTKEIAETILDSINNMVAEHGHQLVAKIKPVEL